MSIRDQITLVPHMRRDWDDPSILDEGVTNLVYQSDALEQQWIVKITEQIGDWRSKSRSTYIRWALAINGMLQAAETYGRWDTDRKFQVRTMRVLNGAPTLAVLAEWEGERAAKNHKDAADLLAAYGICDLYGCLEEIVFAAYRVYLDHNPTKILGGAEFKALRQLFYRSQRDAAARQEWCARWTERIEAWQRKRAYDGLGTVFLAFTRHAELRKPHWYKKSDPQTWSETITGIAELRNLITHGAATVSEALAEFSTKPHNVGFDFKAGQPLQPRLRHMMAVECFIDQLLRALNASLIERGMGPREELKMLLG